MIGLPWKVKGKSFLWKRKPGPEKKKKAKSSPYSEEFSPSMQIDEVEIEIEGVNMRLKRKLNLDVPHEISVIVPRAEIRRRKVEARQIVCEEEVLLNSITIVHAPCHPLAGESPPGSNSGRRGALTPGPKKTVHHNYSDSGGSLVPKINLNYNFSP